MKNKPRLLLIITPFVLFAAVMLLGNRDRTPANTRLLQTILSRANYASFFDSRNAGAGVTLSEQTFYRGKRAKEFATHFRLSDAVPDERVQGNLAESYVCDFSIRKRDGTVAEVAYVIMMVDPLGKEHLVYIEASGMRGKYLLEESSARDLEKIFAAHDARTKTAITR